MHCIFRRPWDLAQTKHTSEDVFNDRNVHRREFLSRVSLGIGGLAISGAIPGCQKPTLKEVITAGSAPGFSENLLQKFPADRDDEFKYGRPETNQLDAAAYCNFYEFTGTKSVWKYVKDFKPIPWKIEVDGLCAKPRTFDLDDICKEFEFEERAYRHRCVETWAMCVPWTGFPLRDLIEAVEPKPTARFVNFETFNRPKEASRIATETQFPWPYQEGLTIQEATNPLAMIATGVYGKPLLKQHGAPIRLVVPWKYGFKSIKSIVKITLTDRRPSTFWNTLLPSEYAFEANVDPQVSHPRWSQRTEWMLGSGRRFDTVKYNGYGDHVAAMYSS